jgi:hypothetical protein
MSDAEWLTPGIDDLAASRPAALAVFGESWRDALTAESLNLGVATDALLAHVRDAHRPGPVLVRGISPLTEGLCKGLSALGYAVSLDAGGYLTTATEMFGAPLVSSSEPANEAASRLVVDADVRWDRAAEPSAKLVNLGTKGVQGHYLRLLLEHRRALLETLRESVRANPQHVLFVSQKSYYNQMRVSAALRRRGFSTVAVVMDPGAAEHKQSYFDQLVSTDTLSLIVALQSLSGALLHTQGWLFRQHIAVLIDAFLPRDCQQVVEWMDLNSLCFPEQALPLALPHMQTAWGADVGRRNALQLACEQYVGRHADGVLYPGSDGHIEALGLRGLGRERHLLQFLSYPLQEFFFDPRQSWAAEPGPGDASSTRLPRLGFAGGVIPTDAQRPAALFGDGQMVSTAKLILEQGVPLDVYNNPLHAPPSTYAVRYKEHLELAQRFAHYRFAIGALPRDVGALLSSYDLALMVYDYQGVVLGEDHFRLLIPAKVFMYLEAGLPLLVSRRARATADFAEEHGFGIGVSDEELRAFPAFLRGLNLPALRRGVLKAREALSMDRQIVRLIELYASIRSVA